MFILLVHYYQRRILLHWHVVHTSHTHCSCNNSVLHLRDKWHTTTPEIFSCSTSGRSRQTAGLKPTSGTLSRCQHRQQEYHVFKSQSLRFASQACMKYFTYSFNLTFTEFYVDGTSIPEVHFDVGPSWSGLMPISGDANETRKVRNLNLDSSTL